MRARVMLSVALAACLFLGLCATLAGLATSAPDYTLSTADGLSLTLSADGQVIGLEMDGEPLPITPGPVLSIRDMSAAGQVSAPNPLANPGFEDGWTGWQTGIQIGTLIALTDAVSHSGGWSLQLHGVQTATRGAGSVTADPVAVTPGQRYRLSGYFLSSRGYVRGLDGTPPTRQDQAWRGLVRPNGIYLTWLDAQGLPVSDLDLVAPLHWEANSWRKVSGEVRAPPEATQLELTIGGRLQDEYLWVDDLSIVASPEVEQPVTGTVIPCAVPLNSSEFPRVPGNSGELRGNGGNSGECLVQTATLTTGLTLTATYTAEADHIAVHVELQDTLGTDRALEVVWGLPLSLTPPSPLPLSAPSRSPPTLGGKWERGRGAQGGGGEGWYWWDDVRHSRPITTGTAVASPPPEYPFPSGLSWTYEHVVSGVWDGWLPISLYPYALITLTPSPAPNGYPPPLLRPPSVPPNFGGEVGEGEGGQGGGGEGFGLALAVSLDSPRLVKLAYDQEQERFEARGYLGISPLATRLAGRADLSLELYRVDPTWGFRAAMQGFAARHPTWFESPLPLYDYSGYERGFYSSASGAQQVLAYDQENVFAAEYIVAEGVVKDGETSEPLPTYEETIELIEELSTSHKESDRAQAEAITQSVAYGANGDWMIKHVGEYNWAPGVWEIAWETSTDPDIEGGWGQVLWEWRVNAAISATEEISAVLDGVMMDNFMSAPGVDTRPEHLALTDTPLAYHVSNYQPGVHNAANVHEFFLWLRDMLDTRGRDDMAITINFWGIGTPNGLARHIDAFGGEGGSKTKARQNWNPRILDYRRAIAYHKGQAWANGEPDLTLEDVREFVNLALFYAIFPTRKDEATGWEEGADQLITDTQEVLLRFSSAGWEPVTYARSDSNDVWVERFGSPTNNQRRTTNAKGRSLVVGPSSLVAFTVHNHSDITHTATITIETTPLGLSNPDTAILADLVTTEFLPFAVVEGDIVVTLTLGPRDTRVLKVTECCDFNDDTQVDVVDVQMAAAEWGAAHPAYDFDGSGTVELADLMIVVDGWHR